MKQITCMAFMAMIAIACHNVKKEKAVTISDVQLSDSKNVYRKEERQKTEYATDTVAKQVPTTTAPSSTTPKANPDWDKKIIKTANVSLELKDFNGYNNSVHQSLKAYGAYIAQEEQTQIDNATQNIITIKVPVDRFEDLMNTFSGDGIKVLEKKITTEDVTGEVIDTKGRIETKKQVRQQYMELLKQAKSMKDILEVQNEINGITEEVEAAGGRVQYLVHQAAYSTIHLKYFQYTNGIKPVDEQPSFLTKLKEAFKSGGNGIAGLAIFLTNIWPFILVVVAAWIAMKKRNKNRIPIKEDTAV